MFKKTSNRRLQRGQGMTEYIIIVGVIAIAAIGAFGYFGSTVEKQIGGMAKELAGGDGTQARTDAETQADKAIAKGDGVNDLSNYTTGND